MNIPHKVVVAGSINMDVVVTADRLPRTGETVPGKTTSFIPGGKGANQAVAAAKVGASTMLIGKVGVDSFGDDLIHFLKMHAMDSSMVQRTTSASTGTALIVVNNESDNTIVVVPGANGLLSPDDLEGLTIQKGDVFVSQFEIPLETIRHFFRLGKKNEATTVLNPAPARRFDRNLLNLVDVLIVNETELAFMTGEDVTDNSTEDEIAGCAKSLRASADQVVVVTLGAQGLLALWGERQIRIQGHSVQAVDTTGAGDCFVGVFAARLSMGKSLEEAMRYANTAASLCVQSMGAGPSMPKGEEVEKRLLESV